VKSISAKIGILFPTFAVHSTHSPMPYKGEIAALLTALFWTVTAMAFEASSKRIGSLTLNLLRLFVAIGFFSVFSYFYRGMALPTDAPAHAWIWLSVSAIIGFVIGDFALFQSFILIGARVALLIMSLVPPITAFIAWLVLGEKLGLMNFIGMCVTLLGIALVVLGRGEAKEQENFFQRIKLSYSVNGILLAVLGAACQATGLVLSKLGMGDYDNFAASHIRVIVGAFSFAILFSFMGKWKGLTTSLKDKKAMIALVIGAFFGPFLGVSFSLMAVKFANTGVASTIMSMAPVFIIPPAVLFFKEKLKWKEVIGSTIAVVGVALFFLK
jgi:drug/metabolite transporter (DMT)-like permease